MVNVHVMKLGSYYEDYKDRGSGRAEFNYISNAIEKACDNVALFKMHSLPIVDDEDGRVVTFVVNGKVTPRDHHRVKTARKFSDVMVFICTNLSLVEENKNAIMQCDYVLHQSAREEFSLYGMPGEYSHVPELFYDERIPGSMVKMPLCFFGGKESGREAEFNEFVVDNSTGLFRDVKPGIVPFFKSKDGQDFRLPYDDYRRILPLYRFVLVSDRYGDKEAAWVTPRLVEAVNAGCVPILVNGYDPLNHFGFKEYSVDTYKEMEEFMHKVDDPDTDEINFAIDIYEAKARFLEGQEKFDKKVRELIKNLAPLGTA